MDTRWPWRRLMGAKGAAPTRRHAAPTACCAGLPPIYGCQRPWPPLAPTVPTHGLPAPTVLGVGWIRMMPTRLGLWAWHAHNRHRKWEASHRTWRPYMGHGAHSWARGASNPWARWCPLVGAGCPQSEWGKGTDVPTLKRGSVHDALQHGPQGNPRHMPRIRRRWPTPVHCTLQHAQEQPTGH
jgi:hypothetical protein